MEMKTKKPLLLVIEDNPDTRGIYKDVFEREGFQVLLAEDGEKGLSYAQATVPNVILLDLMLPKISGLDILKRLRAQEETRHIPVMIFSARDAAADTKQIVDLGMTEYSVKALNTPKQMVSRVRLLLLRGERPPGSLMTPPPLQIALKDSLGDASRLQSTFGFVEGFHCPQCNTEVLMNLMPDPNGSEGHGFKAHFVCSTCHRVF